MNDSKLLESFRDQKRKDVGEIDRRLNELKKKQCRTGLSYKEKVEFVNLMAAKWEHHPPKEYSTEKW